MAGGQAIKQEQSTNLSFGLSSELGSGTTLTLDFYQIEVDDRIYRTRDIPQDDGTSISFYTNAIDVKHSGFDLVVTSDIDWSGGLTTDVSLAYAYNKIEVTGQRMISGVLPVNVKTVEDIENNFPKSRFVLTTNTAFGDSWNLMLRANYYGSHYDERGEINNPADLSAQIGAIVYIDAQLTYQLNDDVKLKLGFANMFDEYIDEIDAPNANRQSVGLQYPRRSAANYEGGSWYLGMAYSF